MRRKKNENHRDPFARWQRISSRARIALLLAGVLAPVVFLCGCSGGQSAPSTLQTYTISGTLNPAAGGNGATLALSGPASAGTTANSSGNYTFAGLANGTYAITPSHTGYTFSPNTQSVTVNGANVSNVNFTAAQQTHSVALSWNASSTSGVTGYNVYRSTVSGAGYIKISSTLGTVFSYTDTTVANGTTYYYVTRAVDASGIESDNSNQASAMVP
jgi:hypothetical protein